jgi:hypothetical protein
MVDEVPSGKNEKWQALVLGVEHVEFEFFPVKLLLARLQLKAKLDPSQENVLGCSLELQQLFVKNLHIPKAKRDLNKVFKRKFSLRRLFRRRK